MKIGPSYGGASGSPVGGTSADSKQPAGVSQSSGSGVTSTVKLSDLSARLSGTDATSGTSSTFDGKKVQDIKDAITSGTFKVNTSAVADKLVSSVRELLGGAAS